MEFILIGLVSALNLIIIVHKLRNHRTEDAVLDGLLFTLLASLFNGSYAAMVVAMIASLVISLYLWASPSTFFRSFTKRDDVKNAVKDFKGLFEEGSNKKDLPFD